MRLFIMLLYLFGLTIAAVLPRAMELSASEIPKDCGLATNKDVTLSMGLIGDADCHWLAVRNDNWIKSYNVMDGCACLFFANNFCSKMPVEMWTGWVFGPASGDLTKPGTTHYLCGEAKSPFKPPTS